MPILLDFIEKHYTSFQDVVLPFLRPCDRAVLACAGRNGDDPLDMTDFEHSEATLDWALANRCPMTTFTCSRFAAAGNLAALKWARAHGCPWDHTTIWLAAQQGHLHVVKWAREQECGWCHGATVAACANGH
jgi:hypothetical protein